MKSSHKNNFDLLRIAAALCVLYSHVFDFFSLPVPMFMDLTFGSFGVMIFFSISGYLIAQSWEKNKDSPSNYFHDRALRIAPALIPQFFIALVIMFLVGDVPMSRLQSMLWTIPIEILMYFCTPLIMIGRKPDIWLTALVAYLGWKGAFAFFPDNGLGLGMIYCATFIAGSCLYVYKDMVQPRLWGCVIGLLAMKFLGGNVLVSALVIPYIVIWIAVCMPIRISTKFMGDPSYGLYIYGVPCHYLARHFFYPSHFTLYAISSIALTFVLAFLSWNFVEKPALKFKRKAR